MKKILFAIFAHPDDEAFGPSGTLLSEVKSGTEVHLISLTLGEAGMNPDSVSNLTHVRETEWHTAGARIGATSMQSLGYTDGELNNQALIEIGDRLQSIVRHVLAQVSADTVVEFMSMDLNGITGHIDHIVASRATCFAFYQLKQADARISRLRLVCIPIERNPEPNTDWLFMEPGRTPSEIDEIVDNRHLKDEILEIMRCHHTQRADYEAHLETHGDTIGLDHFRVLT